MENGNYNIKLLKYTEWFRWFTISVLSILALFSFIDWINLLSGKEVKEHFLTINSVASFLFFLTAISLLIFYKEDRKYKIIYNSLAIIIVLRSLLKLIEHQTGLDLTFLNLVKISDFPFLQKFNMHNKLAPNTAICLFLTGTSLLILKNSKEKLVLFVQFLAVGIFMIAFLAILGLIYGASSLYSFDSSLPMKFGSSVSLILISLSLLGLRPKEGMIKNITMNFAGGYLLRRILPVAILLPILVGWMRLVGQNSGLFNGQYAIAIHSLGDILIITIFIWVIATSLNKTDIKSKQYEHELKISNDRFFLLADILPVGIYLRNKEGECTYINKYWTKLTGLSYNESLGVGWRRAIYKEDKERVVNKIQEHIKSSEPLFIQYRLYSKNGEIRWILSQAIEEKDENGDVIGFIGSTTDITELKKVQDELETANASKNKLFSIISHDLKGPFTALLGYSELLKNDLNDLDEEEVKRITENLFSSIRDAYNLIDDLLKWAMIQQGNIEPDPAVIDINKNIDKVSEQLKIVANYKGIRILNTIPENVKVFADESMVRTIFRNLISNSIKFSNRNSEVNISFDQDEKYQIIIIKDYGIGIPSEKMKILFDVGNKVSTRGTANEKGTGLGLLLCKDLIEKQNGKIEIESEEGKGTTVKILFRKKC